jgi:hypothetical protein
MEHVHFQTVAVCATFGESDARRRQLAVSMMHPVVTAGVHGVTAVLHAVVLGAGMHLLRVLVLHRGVAVAVDLHRALVVLVLHGAVVVGWRQQA